MPNKLKLSDVLPYLILVLSLGAVIVGSVVFALPWVQQSMDLNQKAKDQSDQIENQLKPKIKILSEQNATTLEDNFKLAITAIPQEPNSLALMNTLERVGKAYGIDLKGIAYASPESATAATAVGASSASGAKEQQFNLSTTSDYPTLMALIKSFENLLPINAINSVRFSKTGQQGGTDLSLSFGLSFYYQPAVTGTIGSSSSSLTALTVPEQQSLQLIQKMKDYPLVPVYKDAGKTNPFR